MRKSLLLALSLLGLFDSLYLWWAYTSPSRPMVCLGGGCDAVRASPFAYPGGIPLPVFGVAMYATLALLVFAEPLLSASLARRARQAVAGISGLGCLFSLYLTGLEAFVLHAWCAWCVVSALAVTLLFALGVLDALRPAAVPEPPLALAIMRRYLALCVAAVVVGTPAFILLTRSGSLSPLPAIPPDVLARLVRPDGHMAGNLSGSLTVVEFGDIQCPACGRAEEVARAVRTRYGDRVRFVFRHFPISSLHSHAQKAAEATECAAAQGKFWEALERFYKGQDDLREEALIHYAAELGLNVEQFRQCLASGAMETRVRRDADDARALGLRATPTFFIGTHVVEGPMQLGAFSDLVEQELTRGAASPAPSATAPSVGQVSSGSAPPTPSGSIGTFGQSPFGAAQWGDASTVCSEAEAQKRQPALIHTPEAKQLFEDGAKTLFVDVRDSKQFKSGRIAKAVNIPVDRIEERLGSLPKDRNIVLYESGRASGDICAAGRAAGRVLLSHGIAFERVKVYLGGLADWEKAGLPLER